MRRGALAKHSTLSVSDRCRFLDKSLGDTASDVISDSSGVGTSQSDTTNSLSIPGTTVVCVESYNSGIAGHLTINQGDILEGTTTTIRMYPSLTISLSLCRCFSSSVR